MRRLAVLLAKFSTVGLTATLVYFLAANALMLVTPLPPPLCSVLAYLAGMIVSYSGQARLTFRAAGTRSQLFRFCILSALGLLVSYICVGVAEWYGLSPHWATVAVALIVPTMSFVLMLTWVFKAR